MVCLSASEKTKWDGYTFWFDDKDERRPPHEPEDNHLHAPMMANTHCFEKNECFNLSLYHDADIVIFEASKPIRGGEMLVVDYGEEYNNELLLERQAARKRTAQILASRPHFSHNYKCPHCGYTCREKFRLSHYNSCGKRKAECGDGTSQPCSGDE